MIDEKQQKEGFTLGELLVVVAIIDVLVAVSIPIFTSQLERTRSATCLANRTSLKRMMIYDMMDEGFTNDNTKQSFEKYSADFKCPSGGTISYEIKEGNQFLITCSSHETGYNTPEALEAALDSMLSSLGDNNKFNKGNRIDSNNSNGEAGWTGKIQAFLDQHRIELENLDTKTWVIVRDQSSRDIFIWTTYDVKSDDYKGVPAIGYVAESTDSKGKKVAASYIVGTSSVYHKNDYYSIANGAEKSTFTPSDAQTYSTYEEALAAYQQLAAVKK